MTINSSWIEIEIENSIINLIKFNFEFEFEFIFTLLQTKFLPSAFLSSGLNNFYEISQYMYQYSVLTMNMVESKQIYLNGTVFWL